LSEQDPEDFLGVGWSFPVQTSPSLVIQMSKYEQDIQQAILIILQTAKGERVMNPDFGCAIHAFVFESMNTSLLTRIESSVSEALTSWEPRIQNIVVTASPDNTAEGRLLISISCNVIATNNNINMVYPFFLTEGGG
jgi:uncharacterized protein